MNCPECGAKTQTINSRNMKQAQYRRHKCLGCGQRFSTQEVICGKEIKSFNCFTLAEKLVYKIGYKSKLTEKTYLTKEEDMNDTINELVMLIEKKEQGK